jgi:hypothetical protein
LLVLVGVSSWVAAFVGAFLGVFVNMAAHHGG